MVRYITAQLSRRKIYSAFDGWIPELKRIVVEYAVSAGLLMAEYAKKLPRRDCSRTIIYDDLDLKLMFVWTGLYSVILLKKSAPWGPHSWIDNIIHIDDFLGAVKILTSNINVYESFAKIIAEMMRANYIAV
jgi:hypothetical protein